MTGISIDSVTKTYGSNTTVITDLSLEVMDSEFMVLVGPSGCGKSTLLRMVAGLENITGGEIRLGSVVVNDIAAKDRDLAMIFQTYALFPHMTVRQNLSFGMKLRKIDRGLAEERLQRAASTLGLTPYLHRRPSQLSGGQQQRVAIGRALVRNPKAFLMDEPLSNLDTKLRVHMRTEFLRLRDQLRTTTLYVTHDQVEAMTLGHRVCVLLNGEIQQVAEPETLYQQPANVFVAGFIGTPEMNMAMGRIENERLHLGAWVLPLPADRDFSRLGGRDVIVGLRPTDIEHYRLDDGLQPVEIRADLVERLGSENNVIFRLAASPVAADRFGGASEASETRLSGNAGSDAEFTASLSGKIAVEAGQPVTLGIDPQVLHFFDPASGKALPRA